MLLTAPGVTLRLIIGIPLILLSFVVLAWALQKVWLNSFPNKVRQASARYRDIANLNACDDYTFYVVDRHPKHIELAHDRAAFNDFQFDAAMLRLMEDDLESFDIMIFATTRNKVTLREYHEALKYCAPEITRETAEEFELPYQKAKREEMRLIRSIMPTPVTEVDFNYTIRYYCPVKKENLTATKVYTLEEIMALRRQRFWPSPVETYVVDHRRKRDMPQMADVEFRYNAEDAFQEW